MNRLDTAIKWLEKVFQVVGLSFFIIMMLGVVIGMAIFFVSHP